MRESTVRGAAIDINDFERRLRGVEPPRKSSSDPLSELARLMHGEEQAQAARRYDRMFAAESAPSTEWDEAASRKAPDEDAFAAELRGSVHEDFQRTRPDSGAAHESGAYSGEYSSNGSQARGNEFAAADLAARHFAARPGPQARSAASDAQDAWPQDPGPDSGRHELEDDVGYDDADYAPAQGGPIRLRPWHAVAVVALLASSLLAWGFAKRGGVIGGREIAVINAPDGPAKVLPAADADASVDKPEAAVLDRHENAPVKRVVSHQEQAVEPKVESRANYNGAGRDGRGWRSGLVRGGAAEENQDRIRAAGRQFDHERRGPASGGEGRWRRLARRRRETRVNHAGDASKAQRHAARG